LSAFIYFTAIVFHQASDLKCLIRISKSYLKIFEILTQFLNTHLLSPPGERIEVRGRSFLSPLIPVSSTGQA
jgi:hypothetical protein